MPRTRLAQQICAAMILCLGCGLPGASQAESGTFFKSIHTLEHGVIATQYANTETFPPPEGPYETVTDVLLPEVNPARERVVRLVLPLNEKRNPTFILGVPPEREVLMGGIANGTLSLVYYRDGQLSRKDHPFKHSDTPADSAQAHAEVPAWGRAIKLRSPISKEATHLTVTAFVMSDPATGPGRGRQGNLAIIVHDAVVQGPEVLMSEPLTDPVSLKMSEASWRLWHRKPIRAGSGNRLDNAVNAPIFDVAVVEQRAIEPSTDTRHRRSLQDDFPVDSDAAAAFLAGIFEQIDVPAASTGDGYPGMIRFRRAAGTTAEVE
jgi:hypothetical protein